MKLLPESVQSIIMGVISDIQAHRPNNDIDQRLNYAKWLLTHYASTDLVIPDEAWDNFQKDHGDRVEQEKKDGAILIPITEASIIAAAKEKFKRQDHGTCVMGMRLAYKNKSIATQIAQGSITNELYFDEIEKQLVIQLGYDGSKFEIDYGRMD